jgi:haemagglutination activity domain
MKVKMFFALILCAVFSGQSYAVIVPTDGAKLTSISSVQYLTPKEPDSKGISYNRFSDFSSGSSVVITNTTKFDNDVLVEAAKVIVIESNQINLTGKIEIVGETAEVILVNPSSSAYFTNVQFRNISRLTLATANLNYGSASQNIGVITPRSGSELIINGIDAKGVAEVNLVTSGINLNGEINTNKRANYLPNGGYQLEDNGNLVVGSGGVNVFYGVKVNYLTYEIIPTLTNLTPLTLGGKIMAASSKIVSVAPFIHTGVIDTTSDILSSTQYQGNLVAIEEGVSLLMPMVDLPVTLNGSIYSDNKVSVSAGGDLIVNGVVHTKIFNSYIKNQLLNRGKIDASYKVEIATGSMENNGLIKAKDVQVAGDQSLQNRFGGRIFADVIGLTSKNGVVRNGSQYPFKPKDDLVTLLKPDDPQNIKVATINGIPFTGATKVSDLSALILGKSITISANQNIENINPYFEFTLNPNLWDAGIPFNSLKSEQVQIIAENSLQLKSNTYVVNSSAIMGVNNYAGQLLIESPNIANERYNTQMVIDPFSSTTTAADGSLVTVSGNQTNLMLFSPPGVIYSFAKLGFYFPTASGGFINNTAYFEVFNDADFVNLLPNQTTASSVVTSIGLALEQQVLTREQTYITSSKGCTNRPYNYFDEASSRMYYQYCGAWGTNSTSQVNQTSQEMYGTLFSVKGNINGKASNLYGTNHQSIDYIKKQIIQNQIDAYGVKNYTTTQTMTDYAPHSTTKSELSRVVSITEYLALSADGNFINLVRDGIVLSATGNVVNAASAAFKNTPQFTEQTQTVSVTDLVKQKWVEMKAALVKLLQDFQAWWNN